MQVATYVLLTIIGFHGMDDGTPSKGRGLPSPWDPVFSLKRGATAKFMPFAQKKPTYVCSKNDLNHLFRLALINVES